jgi:hypothetical protein
MSKNTQRIYRLLEAAQAVATGRAASRLEEISFCSSYAEPGYQDPTAGLIVFGNWNPVCGFDVPREVQKRDVVVRLARALERAGAELEWSDEWTTCTCCGGALRTSPDCYSWVKSYWSLPDGCGDVCKECVEKHELDNYIEWLEGSPRHADTFGIDFAAHGYFKAQDDFENGFHRGQDADPEVIAESLRAKGIERFLFAIDGKGQFDINFSLWIHNDFKALWVGELDADETDGPSNSEALDRALRSVPVVDCPPGHVVISNIDVSAGTVETKVVPHIEFVAGLN